MPVLVTGPSPRSIGEATALAIARQAPALLILAGRTPVKLDAVAASCREVVEAAAAGVSNHQVPSLLLLGPRLQLQPES